jgi:hypothetical protein
MLKDCAGAAASLIEIRILSLLTEEIRFREVLSLTGIISKSPVYSICLHR